MIRFASRSTFQAPFWGNLVNLALFACVGLGLLAAGYFVYGKLVSRIFLLDPNAVTPAHRVNDGNDYIPTKPLYLFSQHFSAIAAAGPIAGPIIACQQFGWLPCALWITLGVIFIGAVHDLVALVASVRHDAQSIVEIVRRHLGRRASLALMGFIWLSLIYVIIAFTDITAKTFVGKSPEIDFQQGGAVAGASTFYLLLALALGGILRLIRLPLLVTVLVFVPATLVCIWLGTVVPDWFVLGFAGEPRRQVAVWSMLILAYCFAGSLAPVWALLQPRGFLGGFVLFLALAVGVLGIFLGSLLPGTAADFEIHQAAFRGWDFLRPDGSAVALFPILFVTIACGACSGFHGLVCSGTTSKQVDKETDCRQIGYGAMLMEGFVAMISLATVMILADGQLKGVAPGTVYGNGMGRFLTVLIGKEHLVFATTFGAMAFSTFVFDTLDICTRLGRLLLMEVLDWDGPVSMVTATLLTLAAPAYLLWTTDNPTAYLQYWTLFGASNQLLAGLTFLGVTVWLKKSGRPIWFTVPPMIFMMTITLWSLGAILLGAWRTAKAWNDAAALNGGVAVALAVLTALLLWEAAGVLRLRPAVAPVAAPNDPTRRSP